MSSRDYYSVLEIPRKSPISDVKAAFKRLALLHHPDKSTGDPAAFQRIHEAYQILSDENKKAVYDATLDLEEAPDLLGTLLDIFRKQFEAARTRRSPAPPAPPPHPQKEGKKVKKITAKLEVSLDEVYRGEVKKVVFRLMRQEVWTKVPFYISLVEGRGVYTFEGQGDELYGEKGDVQVEVRIREHERVKVDKILCDHDLYIEETMSLYEYYYGIDRDVGFLDGKSFHVSRMPADETSYSGYHCTHVVEGEGLPYMKDNSICYGNLYIYFRLLLPCKGGLAEEAEPFIKRCFNSSIDAI